MKCGAPADTRVSKNMSWYPPWVLAVILLGLLPYVILALALTKRVRMRAPMCYLHRNHWTMRVWIIVLLLVAFVGLIIVGAIVASQPRMDNNRIGSYFFLTAFGLFIGWVIVVIVLQSTAIRPTQINEEEITLTGVSGYFVDATEDMYRMEYARRKSRRRRDAYADDFDDYEEPPLRPPPGPPKPPPPPGAYEES